MNTHVSSRRSIFGRLKVWIERLEALIGLTEEPVGMFVGACSRRLGLYDSGGSHKARGLIPVIQCAYPDRCDIGGGETRARMSD